MLGSKAAKMVSKGLLALTLAGGLTAGMVGTAAASTMTDSVLSCAEGTAGFYLGFPLDGTARMSIYAYQIDNGGWQWTSWYYTEHGQYWVWENGWSAYPADSSITTRNTGGGHTIVAWEYRYDVATRSAHWVSLGSCETSSFFDNPYIFN